jgi:hypothetical protein
MFLILSSPWNFDKYENSSVTNQGSVVDRNRIREKAERPEEQQYQIQESRFETAVIGREKIKDGSQ